MGNPTGYDDDDYRAEPAQPEAIATLRAALSVGVFNNGKSFEAYLAGRRALDTLERDRAAHAAEVERLRGDLAVSADKIAKLEKLWTAWEARAEVALAETAALRMKLDVAAARAERPMPSDEKLATALEKASYEWKSARGQWYALPQSFLLHQARAAKSALLGVRREGPMPKFEAVYGALKETARLALSDQTHAVLALFSAEPKGQCEGCDGSGIAGPTDSEDDADDVPCAVHEPKGQQDSCDSAAASHLVRTAVESFATAVAPGVEETGRLDERPWNYGAPPDSEVEQLHELLPFNPEGEVYEFHTMTYSGLETRVNGLPRWDDKAGGAYRVMGMSVKAWRRAEPKGQPEPVPDGLAGMPTAWRERIESLERVVERKSDELAKCDMRLGLTELRCGEIERAVEGLKGGGR